MIDKLKNIWQKISNFKRGQLGLSQDSENQTDNLQSPQAQSSMQAKKKHDLIVLLGLGVTVIIGLSFMKYRSNSLSGESSEADAKLPLNLEVASHALDIDKMWRNHFEDKLTDAKTSSDEKLKLIEASINEQSSNYTAQLKSEIEKLKAQMQYISEEQASSRREFSNVKANLNENDKPS